MFDDYADAWADDLVDEMLDDIDAEAFAAAVAMRPPGRCTWERHNALQALVHPACDRGIACTDAMTGCANLSKHVLLTTRCIVARDAINRECYGGGDHGHRIALHNARDAARNCRRMWRARACDRRPRGGRNVRRFE